MAIATNAIKSNALGLPVNGVACYGISIEVYDTGSIHHRADAAVSAFDIPTGTATNNVSASVVLRSPSPVAANGLTGYTLSWGYNADGSTYISCFAWTNGTAVQVGQNSTLNVPAPTVGATFSGQISGTQLTAFVTPSGGTATQVASFTDATITGGSYCGLHFFRNVTASNCYFTSFIAYAIAGPVTPPPSGTVDVRLSPFPATDPAKMPRGDGCALDTRPIIVSQTQININDVAFGLSINGAGYTSPAQQDAAENHHCDIQPDGVTVHGFNTFMGANLFTTVNIRTGNSYNCTVIGNAGQYERATKMAGMAYCLRNWELQAAAAGDVNAIKHPIGLGISGKVLNSTYNWPAFATDSFAGSNTGFMPAGSMMAIPSTATMPAGLNLVSQAVWTAGRNFGFYEVDATGGNAGPTPSLTVVECEAAGHAINQTLQMGAILAQARWVTNMSQSNIGGPGNRLAPLNPAV